MERAWLWSTWVKSPLIRQRKRLCIVSACLPNINPDLFAKLENECVVLLACPERENPTHYGKIASIIRSNEDWIEEVWVVTVDGSPHCYTLHASVNEAEYILGKRIVRKHFVVVDGKELREVDPVAVRVARYLHIVQQLIEQNRELVENELSKHSLEHRKSKQL